MRPTDDPNRSGGSGVDAPPAVPSRRGVASGFLPPDGAAYPLILRGAGHTWWRSALGVVLGLSSLLLLPALVNQGVVALAATATAPGEDFADHARRAYAFELPSGMLAANLGVAVLALISWLLVAVVHRVRPRWLSSVRPGIRGRYLLGCLGVAVVALVGTQLLSLAVEPGPGWAVEQRFWAFLVVIVLTSPLQAMAEELFFRGYLLQAISSLVNRAWLGIAVSAVVFALVHGGQNPALFVDRLALGLLAGILVWRTGGLEAAIAAHVISNVAVYVIAGVTTSMATVRATAEISWLDAAFDVTGFAVFAVGAVLLARRMALRTRVDLARGH